MMTFLHSLSPFQQAIGAVLIACLVSTLIFWLFQPADDYESEFDDMAPFFKDVPPVLQNSHTDSEVRQLLAAKELEPPFVVQREERPVSTQI
ncbi:hypothetical protein J31TS4_43810 [Paenibacillus sp. J31TS4]|uniref:hypothetical protein n=1 Tax=Paenibacillus sp. J31TS4 TaxID=2807195 RepID=UPI001B15BFE8|nr:hypothetical protein [Paenibacillus sp. J31TS4]GIP41101.1 hypothetical protein J31TS4_43810 [Paenibacillus sp. J31TS4]